MHRVILLCLGCIAFVAATEPQAKEQEGAAAAKSLYIFPKPHESYSDDLAELHTRHDSEDEHYPYVSKQLHATGHKTKEQQIIEDVYSPDYYEPTIILDFRYLKSGGRQYVRGPGGQVLILPRNVHSPDHSEHRDYDSLIEHLRLRHLARSTGAERRAEYHNSQHSQGIHQPEHEASWY